MASRVSYRRSPAGAVRQLSAAARDAMEEAVRYWHSTYLPLHFEVAGETRYGYQPRSGQGEPRKVPGKRGHLIFNRKYWWRKAFQKHHVRPLVWSGASETAAKSAVKFSVRRMANGSIRATAAMPVPSYFYKFKPGQPDKANELTRTTPDEQTTLVNLIQRTVGRHLQNVSTPTP